MEYAQLFAYAFAVTDHEQWMSCDLQPLSSHPLKLENKSERQIEATES